MSAVLNNALRSIVLSVGCAIVLILIANQIAAQTTPPEPAAAMDQQAAADAAMVPRSNLFDIIKSGGWLMLPILACSVLLTLFVFERLISLRRGRVIPRPFVKRFLEELRAGQLDKEKALELCEENDSPVAWVFAGAVAKWGRPSVEVEQAIIDSGERVTNGLRKYLRLFNGISTISPLLGLLGTVVGMIRAFNDIATADALGRAELLAGGIGQALLTTAAGLTVAIPALIFYLFFLSRVDKLVIEIDALGQNVVNEIAADGTPANTKKKSTRRRAA